MRNNTHLWIMLILTLGIQAVQAQSADSTAYTYEALPDVLFPTGLLHDQSPIHLYTEGTDQELSNFDGSIPSVTVHRSDFEWLYQDLYYSQRLDPNGQLFGTLPAHVEPIENFLVKDANARSRFDVPIYLNWLEYNELDTNALENGLLAYTDDQFQLLSEKLIFGQTLPQGTLTNFSPLDSAQKAVRTKTAFIAGSNADGIYVPGSSIQIDFSLRSALIQSNINLPLVFDIDLGDGQGFQSVAANDVLTATLSTNSIRTEVVNHSVRVRANSGKHTLESTFEITLIFNSKTADKEILTSTLSFPSCYSGLPVQNDAKISIKYADPQLGLQKPLVLVEGFESSIEPYGVLTFEGLASGAIVGKNGQPAYTWMSKLSWLFDSLSTAGYDVIFVDFEESKNSISENMQHVIKTLQWVDDQQPSSPPVLVGASMGGLISRAALNELDKAGCCLNVRAYGTFDSPHNGAFIPIGLQVAAKRFGEMLNLLPSMQVWDKALNTPAAREMLVEHYHPNAHIDRAKLLSLLGDHQPKGVRSFAISNGSDRGMKAYMKDIDHEFMHWGKTKYIVCKQRIGVHQDTLDYNTLGGQKRHLKSVGATVDAHQSASDYLYEGRKWTASPLTFKRMTWCNGWNAYRAQMTVNLGPVIGWSQVDIQIKAETIQRDATTKMQRLRYKLAKQGLKVKKSDYDWAYSELPGGSSNTTEGFASVITTISSPSHTFIPTFSALNVGKQWNSQAIRGRMDLIPFDSYMSPGLMHDQFGANQPHIYTDEDIIHFCMTTLRSLELDIAPTGVLKEDFNIAKEHNTWSSYPSELRSMKIPANRTLSVACSGVVGASTSGLPADPDQNVSVFIGEPCGASVVDLFGTMTIGDHTTRGGTCTIRSGSTLRVHAGGSIVLGPSSTLRIARGATLILHPSATIQWDEGAIELDGNLILDQGADFSPVGTGTFVAEGGTLTFPGGGQFRLTDSRLHLLDSLSVPSNASLFDLDRCSIDVENHSTLVLNAPAQIFNTDVRAVGTKLGTTIELRNAQNRLEHNHFENGNPALRGTSSSSIILENTSFINANVGFLTKGSLHSFYANSFFNCDIGAEVYTPQFTSEWNTYYSCSVGLKHLATSGTANLVRNEFSANAAAGAQFSGAKVRMDCNEVTYNALGIQLQGGELNLGANAGNAFTSNRVAVSFSQLNHLLLDHGHNTFSQSGEYDLQGWLSASAPVANNGAFSFVPANYNDFSFSGSTDMTRGRTQVHAFKQTNGSPSPYLCPTKGIKKAKEPELTSAEDSVQFELFPNPSASSMFQATFPPVAKESAILVFTVQGELVHTERIQVGQHRAQVQFNGQSGTYIVRFVSDEHTFTKRWILAP